MSEQEIKDSIRVTELLQEMREIAFRNSPTRDEKVPRSQNLAVGPMDTMFDIDIFFSRKPGMRRSIQLISSEAEDDDCVKLSCLTALASLCDTMIDSKPLNITEEDIVKFMISWLDVHHIKIADLRKNS